MSDRTKTKHEWVLLYYMSYDNNLEHCGPIILNALERGVRGTQLVVTVLADDTEQNGLKRHTITSKGRQVEVMNTDNSASEEVVGNYLTWVAKHHPAKHYAMVFLDHGGRLDEMCLDEWPSQHETKHWLSARLVGPMIKRFRERVSGEVDLLFLQQCGRGSLENLYNFRGAAVAIMASQMNVGAPNTYYEATLQWLADSENATGVDLARQIMSSDEHFNNYVCVDGQVLEELPAVLSPVVRALLNGGESTPKPAVRVTPCFQCEAEKNYDLLEWLADAFRQSGQSRQPLDPFKSWIRQRLVLALTVHPTREKSLKGLCGLSLFVPESEEVFESYRDYPIYQDTCLGNLWKAMYLSNDTLRRH
jgi:hypothetical protein